MAARLNVLPRPQGFAILCSRFPPEAVELNSCLAIVRPRPLPVTAPQPAGKPMKGQTIGLEWLWQMFLSNPLKRWDKRAHKIDSRSPDLRRKHILRIASWSDSPVMIQSQPQSCDSPRDDMHHAAPGGEFNRVAGLNQTQLFVGHQNGGRGSPANYSGSERGPREGLNKSCSGNCGYVKSLCKAGRLKEAVHVLNQHGIRGDSSTYACLLQGCINMKYLAEGKQVHAHIVKIGFKPNVFLLNTLVNMYAKCGSVVEARKVFDKMPERNMLTWNIMIAGYAKHGGGGEAFKMYEQMQWEGVIPNRVTFICIFNACARLKALEKGKKVHEDLIKACIPQDIILETALLDMYAKCGSMKDACQVFDNMAERNVVSWNAMITGYAQHEFCQDAFEIYERMQQQGLMPDRVTFISVLNACASLGDLEKGREVHAEIIKAGIVPHMNLETAIVDMYSKCRSTKDAREVFDNMVQRDVVSWSAMIAGYAQDRCGREAFEIYEQMQKEGVTPDRVTFVCILNACATLGVFEKGKQVHADIIKAGIASCSNLETALADMYAKCGSMIDAIQVFNNMATRDVVSWSVMIAGYAQHGCNKEVLQLYRQMQREGVKPDGITFVSVLSACSHIGLVDEGCHYFDSMSHDHGLTPTVEHYGCMVDLLGRAGRLDEAENLINQMPIEPDTGVWMALLGACMIYGDVAAAERAAKSILKSDPQHPAAYMLLPNI